MCHRRRRLTFVAKHHNYKITLAHVTRTLHLDECIEPRGLRIRGLLFERGPKSLLEGASNLSFLQLSRTSEQLTLSNYADAEPPTCTLDGSEAEPKERSSPKMAAAITGVDLYSWIR